jgi:hypothetical protein
MGIERSAIGPALRAWLHIFDGDIGSLVLRRSFWSALTISIDTSGGFEAVPNDRDNCDQNKEFGKAKTEHYRLVTILDIVLIIVLVKLRRSFGFHPAHRLKAVPNNGNHGDQDYELHWAKHVLPPISTNCRKMRSLAQPIDG